MKANLALAEERDAEALQLLEGVLQAEYSAEVPDFALMGAAEKILASLLDEVGEHERAKLCAAVGAQHWEIAQAKRIGPNAPDAVGVPFPDGGDEWQPDSGG